MQQMRHDEIHCFDKISRDYCRACSTHVNRRDSIFTECNFEMKMYKAYAIGFHLLAEATSPLASSLPPPKSSSSSSSTTSHAFILQHKIVSFRFSEYSFLLALDVAPRYEVPRKTDSYMCARACTYSDCVQSIIGWYIVSVATSYMNIDVTSSDNGNSGRCRHRRHIRIICRK